MLKTLWSVILLVTFINAQPAFLSTPVTQSNDCSDTDYVNEIIDLGNLILGDIPSLQATCYPTPQPSVDISSSQYYEWLAKYAQDAPSPINDCQTAFWTSFCTKKKVNTKLVTSSYEKNFSIFRLGLFGSKKVLIPMYQGAIQSLKSTLKLWNTLIKLEKKQNIDLTEFKRTLEFSKNKWEEFIVVLNDVRSSNEPVSLNAATEMTKLLDWYMTFDTWVLLSIKNLKSNTMSVIQPMTAQVKELEYIWKNISDGWIPHVKTAIKQGNRSSA